MVAHRTVLVMSGKGGVGKSSVAVQLALVLAGRGLRVGILDADLCGPSAARLLGIESARITQGASGLWHPVEVAVKSEHAHRGLVRAVSMAFLLPSADDAVVWRGPKKTAMIRQFVNAVAWGDIDVLVVDTPPGTSDEHMALAQCLQEREAAAEHSARFGTVPGIRSTDQHPSFAALLVTTPQRVALRDVERQLSFCSTVGVPVLGLVENMSGYACSACKTTTNVFSSQGGRSLAERHGLPLLGVLPIAPGIGELLDGGTVPAADRASAYCQALPSLHLTMSAIADIVMA